MPGWSHPTTPPTSRASTCDRSPCSCPAPRRPPPWRGPPWTPPVSDKGPPCPPPLASSGRDPAGGPHAGFSVHPVVGPPEFSPGDDLAAAVAGAAPWLADGDVVVVTSKVVSKVEGRLVPVAPGEDREKVRLQAVEDEAGRVG